jgi:hypothetical protein
MAGRREYNVIHTEPAHQHTVRTQSPVAKTKIASAGAHTTHRPMSGFMSAQNPEIIQVGPPLMTEKVCLIKCSCLQCLLRKKSHKLNYK